jgi:hypothetical protein
MMELMEKIATPHNMLMVAAIENLLLLWVVSGLLGYCLRKVFHQNVSHRRKY